mmetsp:Transcript_20082/g.29684  ORF Transcript_20082/g.29684 Transcript_20082/m.29684 type:complete len:113 (+) Transcript_20082:185-523(+)
MRSQIFTISFALAMNLCYSSKHASNELLSSKMNKISPPQFLRGVLFDMDGTMVDGDEYHFQAFRETILRNSSTYNGGKPITIDYYRSWMSGNSNEEISSSFEFEFKSVLKIF